MPQQQNSDTKEYACGIDPYVQNTGTPIGYKNLNGFIQTGCQYSKQQRHGHLMIAFLNQEQSQPGKQHAESRKFRKMRQLPDHMSGEMGSCVGIDPDQDPVADAPGKLSGKCGLAPDEQQIQNDQTKAQDFSVSVITCHFVFLLILQLSGEYPGNLNITHCLRIITDGKTQVKRNLKLETINSYIYGILWIS